MSELQQFPTLPNQPFPARCSSTRTSAAAFPRSDNAPAGVQEGRNATPSCVSSYPELFHDLDEQDICRARSRSFARASVTGPLPRS